MKIAVVCNDLVPAGGLIRFERVGNCLASLGHEVVFVPLKKKYQAHFPTELSIVSFKNAIAQSWDAVIVPGAGFPGEVISRFSKLKADNFGVRIQMILNDQSRRERFLAVNSAFNPDLVVFNNDQWPIGSFREFRGRQFRELIGAVDTTLFTYANRSRSDKFVIGAQLKKSPKPLIEALSFLPEKFVVRFFGAKQDNYLDQFSALMDSGKVEWVGPLFGRDLADYYHGLDAIVSTETFAGWANIVAEAMSSGVPVVTTPSGTGKIAFDGLTAHVIESPQPEAIARALKAIATNPDTALTWAKAARRNIEAFDWSSYSSRLVDLIFGYNGQTHYVAARELGLFGKTSISERIQGLSPLLEIATGKTILDLGAAEAVISKTFSEYDPTFIHAYEIEQSRVDSARKYLNPNIVDFQQGNLSSLDQIAHIEAKALPNGYDIVLYLGIHQHIHGDVRNEVFSRMIDLAADWIAVRTPVKHFESDALYATLKNKGFCLTHEAAPDVTAFSSPLWIYQRRSNN
jgi:glycosyltransferase involved in cell wall biosynthesis